MLVWLYTPTEKKSKYYLSNNYKVKPFYKTLFLDRQLVSKDYFFKHAERLTNEGHLFKNFKGQIYVYIFGEKTLVNERINRIHLDDNGKDWYFTYNL
jgi:hypothetical protein